MKTTQAMPMLKRLPPPVTRAMGLVADLLASELVVRTRGDNICLDLCR
jgi:hypothetical protein